MLKHTPGNPESDNDRPPLVLHAGVKRANGAADYPLTVIVNHLRSLNGITDSSTGATVRAKRETQAEYLEGYASGHALFLHVVSGNCQVPQGFCRGIGKPFDGPVCK